MMPKTNLRPLLLLSLLTAGYSNANEELPLFTEQDLLIDIPEVVSATHLSQRLTETPAAITVIDRQTIEASGAVNIPDLFRLVPGMSVFHVHSNKFGVTYHGVSDDFPRQMEVMINGRSVYIPLISTVVWETMGITVNDIDHIEVVRGSNVPTHGSNAFLGAINIITRSPVQDQSTELLTTQGALNTENYAFRHASNINGFQFSLSGGYLSNRGLKRFEDGSRIRHINLEGVYTPSLTDTLHISMGYSTGYADRGDGSASNQEDAAFVPRQHISHYQALQWKRTIDPLQSVKLSYQHNYLDLNTPRYSDDEIQALLEAEFGPLPPGTGADLNALNAPGIHKDSEVGTTEVHDLELLHTIQLSPQQSAVIGTGVRHERAKSNALFDEENDRWIDETRWRLFGNLESQTATNWVFNLGAMMEHSSIAGTRISPRIAANYLLDKQSTIRTALTRAYRMPSILAEKSAYTVHYPLGVGDDVSNVSNPDIGPEQISSFEIGYFRLFPNFGGQLDIRAFYEDIDDGIGSVFIPYDDDVDDRAITQDNNYDWTNQGFEFQFKYTSRASHASSVLFNYSYNNIKGDRDRGLKRVQPLDEAAPMHLGSILLSTKPSANSILSLSYYYLNMVRWLEGSSDEDPNTLYQRADLRYAHSFNLDTTTELEAAVIVQNLFDKGYPEFYRYNEFDRRTYLQLKLHF